MLGDMLGHIFRASPAARRAATSESLAYWKQVWTSQGAPRQRPATLARALSSSCRTAAKRPLLRQVLWKPSELGRTARAQTRGFRFSAWRGNAQAGGGAEESLSLSQRLKKLSREYGWSAVGVYFALSVLDFPFCFLLVRIVGTDRIAALEHWVVSNVSQFIPDSVKAKWADFRASFRKAEEEHTGDDKISEAAEKAGWGVEEAQRRNSSEASLGTQLALAYAIHKSFIFLRVPLTAAVTPKVVKVLRSWGWQIGKRKAR